MCWWVAASMQTCMYGMHMRMQVTYVWLCDYACRYCSVECQAAHWALEHKGVCGKLRSLFGAAAAAAEQQAVGPAE